MTTKQRFPLSVAEVVAEELVELLSPVCERIQIAGSLRRKKAEVGDIELLCVPNWQAVLDLFGEEVESMSLLDGHIETLMAQGILEQRGGMGKMNKLMRHNESGIPVDIFSTSQDHWGMALVVRTGPKELNIKLMGDLKRMGHEGHAYGVATYGDLKKPSSVTLNRYRADVSEVMCPTELEVFDIAGWRYIPPTEREWPAAQGD